MVRAEHQPLAVPESQFGFTDEQARPYTFDMAPFLADKQISQQGFVSFRTLRDHAGRRAAGGAPDRRRRLRQLPDHDQHLEEIVDEKKDVVQRFIDATG